MLHSNGQLRTERDRNTKRGCEKPAVQQKTTDDDTSLDCKKYTTAKVIYCCDKGYLKVKRNDC